MSKIKRFYDKRLKSIIKNDPELADNIFIDNNKIS